MTHYELIDNDTGLPVAFALTHDRHPNRVDYRNARDTEWTPLGLLEFRELTAWYNLTPHETHYTAERLAL